MQIGVTTRALLVEDEPDAASLLQNWLGAASPHAAFESEVVRTMAEAMARLKQAAFDIVVLDLGLPDSQGPATVKRCHAAAPALPILIVTGLSDEAVVELVAQANAGEDTLWIANYNAPGQVVIAGQQPALERALSLAKERGAKRALPLAVSVAAHTPLMRAGAERLAAALEATPFQAPWVPVIQNATASPATEPQEIKAALVRQLTSPVRWVESVRAMLRQGVTQVVELGPRSVLAGLIRRIDEAVAVQSLTDAAGLEAYSWEA